LEIDAFNAPILNLRSTVVVGNVTFLLGIIHEFLVGVILYGGICANV